jgi:hypothetical protein
MLDNADSFSHEKRLRWPVLHSEYDDLTNHLFSWLNNISLDRDDFMLFEVVRPLIYQSLASYLTHLYDSIKIKESGLNPIFSDQSNVYLSHIYKNTATDVVAYIELEKNRFKDNFKKATYSKIIERMPKIFMKKIRISRNPLNIQDGKYVLDLLCSHHFPINISTNSESIRIASIITNLLVEKIERKYFLLERNNLDSIFNIVKICMSRVVNDIDRYNGFLKHTSLMLSGTGCKYHNRLLPYIVKNHHNNEAHVKVFSHGGERVFFEDAWYWDWELSYATEYVSYGEKSSVMLDKMIGNRVRFKSIGSSFHKEIYNRHYAEVVSDSKKVLYIPNSFVGESRQFPNAKLIDPVLYDWQVYLIKKMKFLGYTVIYKTHPKGFFHDSNNIGLIADYETSLSMDSILNEVNIVVSDSAGSAVIESICAGKHVTLIDMKQRPLNKLTLKDFEDLINIVSVDWVDNLPYIDDNLLLDALQNTPSVKENQKKLIKEYFING